MNGENTEHIYLYNIQNIYVCIMIVWLVLQLVVSLIFLMPEVLDIECLSVKGYKCQRNKLST